MHLVDRDGRTQLLVLWPLLYPGSIIPPMLVCINHDTGSSRTQLSCKAIWVGLLYRVVVKTRVNGIFVKCSRLYTWHKAFPDPQLLVTQVQRVSPTLPVIEIPDDRDRKGIWRPNGKVNAG